MWAQLAATSWTSTLLARAPTASGTSSTSRAHVERTGNRASQDLRQHRPMPVEWVAIPKARTSGPRPSPPPHPRPYLLTLSSTPSAATILRVPGRGCPRSNLEEYRTHRIKQHEAGGAADFVRAKVPYWALTGPSWRLRPHARHASGACASHTTRNPDIHTPRSRPAKCAMHEASMPVH